MTTRRKTDEADRLSMRINLPILKDSDGKADPQSQSRWLRRPRRRPSHSHCAPLAPPFVSTTHPAPRGPTK